MILDNQIAIITGSGSGIGQAAAKRFAAAGAHVVIAEMDSVGAERTAASIAAAGGRSEIYRLDATEPDAIRGMISRVRDSCGRIDVLFCHVGGRPETDNLDATDADVQRAFDRNVRGSVAASLATVPIMRDQGGGSIIYTASVAALHASSVMLYGMAKAAVLSFMRSLAVQVGPHGIRVNAVVPGPILTPALRRFLRADEPRGADRITARAAQVPLRRLGNPEDVAEVALFLASPGASFVTGVALPVDGGVSLTVP